MVVHSDTASSSVLVAHRAAVSVLAGTPRDTDAVRGLSDAELLELGRVAASQRRLVEATVAAVAGEIARRSDPELGGAGLARTTGYRTPEGLLQELTGSSKRAANRDVQVGRVLSQNDDSDSGAESGSSWLAPVREAMLGGTISAEHAAAISHELGVPDDELDSEVLGAAATELVSVATTVHADRLRGLARDIRNELDADGAQEREAALRAKRSLRLFRQDDGTTRLVWVMDPETAAVVTSIVDRATSPRLGGPRFVDTKRAAAAAAIVADARSTEQLASDVIRDLLAAGAQLDGRADRGEHLLLQVEQPAVKILVTEQSLTTGTGAGHLEGSGTEVSVATIERAICTGSVQHLAYTPSGQALDVGRQRRLFTARQREVLAATWGGCAIPWCERPPTWCEYHHIEPWDSGGGTDVDNGMLLCRCHHVDLHNNGWQIRRTANGLELRIPGRHDPVPLEPKGKTWRTLRRAGAA